MGPGISASLHERMKEIPDPRCGRRKRHDLADVLTYVIMGYICGRIAIRRALSWAEANMAVLKRYMVLDGGIASASTVSRLLGGIDEEIFALVFADWASRMLGKCGLHIIIDGKAIRAATRRIGNGNTPYVLNAVDAATQLVLAQLPIAEKANEVTAIPELLEWLELRGNLVTVDAIGTQTAIMEKLDGLGAGFLMQVKMNQPEMYREICGYIEYVEDELGKVAADSSYRSGLTEKDTYDRCESDERNRERHEHREMVVSTNTGDLPKISGMPYIKTIGVSRQVRAMIVKDAAGNDVTPPWRDFAAAGSGRQPKTSEGDGMSDAVQKVGIVSNREMTAAEAARVKREHWRIENGLHHVLDDAFREDRFPAKGSKNNLALVRKIAYNIIRYALLRLERKSSVIGMMDYFADNPRELAKYIFLPLEKVSVAA